MPDERLENSLRARRLKIGLTRCVIADLTDIPWSVISAIEQGEEPDGTLLVADCFRIAQVVYAIPRVICEGRTWDESTPYKEIRRAGGQIELQFVRPLKQQDLD